MFHVKHDDEFADGRIADAALTVFGDHLDRARVYRGMLADAGVVRGLIGPREVDRLWSRHLLNCAVVADALPRQSRVTDIGSGAGLPGIPIALADPGLAVTLIEPLERRAEFLEEVVRELELSVTVVRGRAEEPHVRRDHADADIVTSRAVAPLDRLVRWSAPLIRPGGEMVAIKGASARDEVTAHGSAMRSRGLVGVRVMTVGADILDTPTTIVRGERRARGGGSGQVKGSAGSGR